MNTSDQLDTTSTQLPRSVHFVSVDDCTKHLTGTLPWSAVDGTLQGGAQETVEGVALFYQESNLYYSEHDEFYFAVPSNPLHG